MRTPTCPILNLPNHLKKNFAIPRRQGAVSPSTPPGFHAGSIFNRTTRTIKSRMSRTRSKIIVNQHSYLTRIDDAVWTDLLRVKFLDGRSLNSLIQEGCRLVAEQKKQMLVNQRKIRNTLSSASGW
jgi:hypothetical protein